MARVAPTLYDFVEADNGDYLKVAEAVFRIFDRQDWLRVNRARARIKVLVDKIGIDAFRELRRRGARRATGSTSANSAPSWSSACASTTTRRPTRPRRRRRPPRRTATAPSSSASSQATSRRSARRASPPSRSRSPAATSPRSSSAASARSCASTPAATPAAPCSRTSSCAGSATSRSTTSGSGSTELGLGEAGAARDHRRRLLPRHRQLQTRDHQLDGPQPGDQGAGRRRCRSSDELTKRIHIKMSGCPNGCSQHHIANIGFYGASLKVGGRQMPAYIPHIGGNFEGGEVIFGTRLKSRLPAKRVPEAVERWIRLYESERERGRGVQRLRRAGRRRALRSRRQGPDAAGRVQPRDDAAVHRLEPLQPLQGRARRGGVRDLARATRDEAAARHPLRHRADNHRPRPRGDRRRARGPHRPGGAGVDVRELRRASTTSPARSRKRAR